MAINYNQEKKWAQKELMKAAIVMSGVKMRLEGTQYNERCKRITSAMYEMNESLLKEIRKMK